MVISLDNGVTSGLSPTRMFGPTGLGRPVLCAAAWSIVSDRWGRAIDAPRPSHCTRNRWKTTPAPINTLFWWSFTPFENVVAS